MQEEEREIGRELFGYKKDDVDRLLAELHRDLRVTKEENEKIKVQLASAEEKLSKYEDISDTLKNTMINAEKTASQIVDQAQKEAQVILVKAKGEASKIIEAADTERQALESGYKALETAEKDLHAKIKSIVSSYMNLIENIKPEAAATAKRVAPAPAAMPEEKPAIAKEQVVSEERAVKLPADREKLVVDKLSHLGSIQGVSTAWVFDNKANILSSFNRLKIDLQGITTELVSLDGCVGQLESRLQDEAAKLIFIEFNKVIFILNPLTDTISLGIISAVTAPVGQIFWYLNKEVPELRKLLV